MVESHCHPAADTSEQLQPLLALIDIVDPREIRWGSDGYPQHASREFTYLPGILLPLLVLKLGFAVA